MGELPPPPLLQQQQQQERQEDEEEGVGVVPPLYSYRSPSCFRFNPTDQELVVYFLSNKISGRRGLKYDPSTIIPTVDIYGPSSSEPWRLCEQLSFPYASITTPTDFFCFTTRKQLHSQGDRCHRRSGFGTWYASGKEEEIWDGGILVGRRSFLSFKVPVPPLDVVTTTGSIHKNQTVTTHWVMYEYRLESSQFQKTVLCRIRNQKKDNDIAHGRWKIPWWEEIPTPSPPPLSSLLVVGSSTTGQGRIGCGDSTVMQQPSQHDQPFSPQTLPPPPPDGVTFTTSDQPEGSHGDEEDDTRDRIIQFLMEYEEEWDQIILDMSEQDLYDLLCS